MKRVLLSICVFSALFVHAAGKPSILLILADDLGYSDLGCYGGEIRTPNLDRLARQGVRFTQAYSATRCCPSRAALLTGLYPHQAHVGDMVDEYARRVRETLDSPAYSDRLNPNAPTIAEALRDAGYRTCMAGKWHLGYRRDERPVARGFERSFSLIEGAMNYHGFGIQHTGSVTNMPMALDAQPFVPPRQGFFATDAFTDFAVLFIESQKGRTEPFFVYAAYTAPHWPLHARPEAIAGCRGKYRSLGWDKVRQERHRRLQRAEMLDRRWPLAPRPENLVAWDLALPATQHRWDEEMSIYAAQVEEMDRGVGRLLKAVRDTGRERDTVVLFLSDNGGAAEDPNRSLAGAVPPARDSYEGYGLPGAHVSSCPFRKTKKFTHEGGIAVPFIVRWPAGIPRSRAGRLVHTPVHLIDILPTCLELGGASFPGEWNGAPALRPEGASLVPLLRGRPAALDSRTLFWEHEGHRAARRGKWKLVASFNQPWELYDREADRVESSDLASSRQEIVDDLAWAYAAWSARVGVKPWPASLPAEVKRAQPAK